MWDEQEKMRTAESRGVEKRSLEIAQQMKSEGLDLDLISRMTGLPIEEIKKL